MMLLSTQSMNDNQLNSSLFDNLFKVKFIQQMCFKFIAFN